MTPPPSENPSVVPKVISNAGLTADFFKALLNQTFDLWYGGPRPEKVELVKVNEGHELQRKPGERMPFSVFFRAGTTQFYVPQGICGLDNEQLGGRLEVFLVPVGPDEAGMLFQGVYN